MNENWLFHWNRIREKLWVKPLLMCLLSIAAAFLATVADQPGIREWMPKVSKESVETLLELVASTMLVIAMFSVGSMVAAYASASSSATPRSFPLVLADDTSQNALSTFIGVFIFSVVALIALKNDFYEQAGVFALFTLTILVFAIVILAFIRWVDSIARLGRLGNTIDKVEKATASAFEQRLHMPYLGGQMALSSTPQGVSIFRESIAYLQRVDMVRLQLLAEKFDLKVHVQSVPGTFCTPNRAIATVEYLNKAEKLGDEGLQALGNCFVLADNRTFDQDPRFGLVVLCEIASRALSPAVNDPGTAIDVIGTLVRLFHQWADGKQRKMPEVQYDRIYVPGLVEQDLFDDAFTGIARDGAGAIEVAVRLQKAFESLSAIGFKPLAKAARVHSQLALARSELAMALPQDIDAVRSAAKF
ncbi:DUF2254 domain-containing protein [Limnobacter parvus]|uniref:DUF2254 domain-containing protein n=1 Tax=Limnobacter parvus TaxID=2939690 RepID=A0ABT1XHR5_9BURK|nr:DUF2254 domain-containing protein [Limnobacter parvus]MCR2745609.1 DUF2254 domain-containing protein [Limnobacter parvus]